MCNRLPRGHVHFTTNVQTPQEQTTSEGRTLYLPMRYLKWYVDHMQEHAGSELVTSIAWSDEEHHEPAWAMMLAYARADMRRNTVQPQTTEESLDSMD